MLAEDHYFFREGMRRLLETNPDLEVVAVCEDLDSLLAAVEAERPDVVVTDIRMPPGNLDEGIRASDRLRREHPDIGVVVLSQYLEPAYALALFEAGTERRAYLLKERVHDVGQLVAAIRAVAEGGSVVDPKVVEALVAEKTRREHSPLNELTQRERDVLHEMAEGKNNAGDRGGAASERTHGREGDPLDLPEARSGLGDRSPQTCEGGDLLPERDCRGDTAGREVELTADRGDPLACVRKLVVVDGGDAEELEAKRGTVGPYASADRAAPQGATREVDRLLDLERIPLQVCGFDIERAEGIRQAARGEDRRIDRPGERPHSLECALDLRSQLLEQTARSVRVGVEKLPCELERHHGRGEILLNAVVQRLLDPPALPVEVGEHVERLGPRVGEVSTLLRRDRRA